MENSDWHVGEIRMFAGKEAPDGWLPCNGQELKITEYQNLYAVVGQTYGTPSSPTNFLLPDLRGRAAIHMGQGAGLTHRSIGCYLGAAEVTLGIADITEHNHKILVGGRADSLEPENHFLGESVDGELGKLRMYGYDTDLSGALSEAAISFMDGCSSKAHENMMPSLGITFIIAVSGGL